jgi:hypothetical protein
LCCYFHEIEVLFGCEGQGLIRVHDSDLVPVGVDHPHPGDPDAVVDPQFSCDELLLPTADASGGPPPTQKADDAKLSATGSTGAARAPCPIGNSATPFGPPAGR